MKVLPIRGGSTLAERCRSSQTSWAHPRNEESIQDGPINGPAGGGEACRPTSRTGLFWLFDTLNQSDLTRVLVTLWATWWARRRAIHDEEFQSPLSTITFINKFLEDLDMIPASHSGERKGVHATENQQSGHWIPPSGVAAKINVDGGLSRDGSRGVAAAVCRDSTGLFLGASAIVFDGLVAPAILEAHACNEAISLALDLNLLKIQVASDCLEVITSINKGSSCGYAALLREINHRRASLSELEFKHEGRRHNSEAHSVAKASSTLALGRHVWLGFVPEIFCISINVEME